MLDGAGFWGADVKLCTDITNCRGGFSPGTVRVPARWQLKSARLFTYRIYGLTVASNLPIAGGWPATLPTHADLRVHLGELPLRREGIPETAWLLRYSSGHRQGKGEPAVRIWEFPSQGCFRVLYDDGTQFLITGGGSEVWATWPAERLTLEDAVVYLLGPILGFVMRLRGTVCLHASAVRVGDQAVALAGGAGFGKSTTAAAFALGGFKVLSDDITALSEQDGAFFVQPGHTRLFLWPASVEALCGAPNALPPLVPNWDKRYLDLEANGSRFQRERLPLGVVYLLDRSDNGRGPSIEKPNAAWALVRLLGNCYVNRVAHRLSRRLEFETVTKLLSTVPVRVVHPHADPARLTELREAIVRDVESLMAPRWPERVPASLDASA
jgi:hypothetical protein